MSAAAVESSLQPAWLAPEDSVNGMTDKMTPPLPPPSLGPLPPHKVLEPLTQELSVAACTNGHASAPLPRAEPKAFKPNTPFANCTSNGKAALTPVKTPSSFREQAIGAGSAGVTAGGSSKLGCLYWVTKIQPTNYDMVRNVLRPCGFCCRV